MTIKKQQIFTCEMRKRVSRRDELSEPSAFFILRAEKIKRPLAMENPQLVTLN
jgi:hypothetical protein